ncbi:MAG: Fe-S cluster assembly protein SufB [Nitrososphaeraceae archaeon]
MNTNGGHDTYYVNYKFRYSDDSDIFPTKRGLCIETIEEFSRSRGEPDWLREFRLRSYDAFINRPIPNWAYDLSKIDFQRIYYSAASKEKNKRLDDGEFSTDTSQALIAQRGRKHATGMDLEYDSDAVYHNSRENLQKMGVIFVGMNTAIKDFPELLEKYFGMVIPPEDSKIAALNSAIWSSGLFMYIPHHVKVNFPVYADYGFNMENAGQFEKNLIIADEGAEVHYIEGCSSPAYTHNVGSFRSLTTELIAKKDAKIRFTAIQNWSKNVCNLVIKRAYAYENAAVEWIDGNIGSRLTMTYPSVYLFGRNAHAKIVSLAFAGSGQHQDVGAKAVHLASNTTSNIVSKSISKSNGKSTHRGLLHIAKGAVGAKADFGFDALILNENSGTDVYPYLDVNEDNATTSYKAAAGKVNADQIFYLMSRGYSESDALSMVVSGFIESFMKELPVEYAVEISRFVKLEMEGTPNSMY